MKKFVSHRKVLALLSIVGFGMAFQVSAQNNAITGYNDLVSALNSGITNITNFNPVNSRTIPVTISLTTSQVTTIQITNAVTIDAGTNYVMFVGNGTNGGTRFFHVSSNASLTLNNLLLTNGGSTNGGAIYNDGTLVISNCVLTGNYATNTNGLNGGSGAMGTSVNGTNGTSGGDAAGGAIYTTGPLMISYSILSNNFTEAGNGGNGGNAFGDVGNGGNGANGGSAYGGALCSTGPSNIFYMTEFIGNECFAGPGGSGGVYATNGPPLEGAGGGAGFGGVSAGGAAFASGSLYITNCLFVDNFAVAGGAGMMETNSDLTGTNGLQGSSALGGALFIADGVPGAWIQNTIFYTNACFGGTGGGSALPTAVGGTGGEAQGGAVWSGANLTQMSFCTVATNITFGGNGGTNGSLITSSLGPVSGALLYRSAGVFVLSASILSYDPVNETPAQNAVGVTDAGYNVSSDASPARSAINPTTKLNANPLLNSGLTRVGAAFIGGPWASQPMGTLQITNTSPAAAFVPGVPGASFPATDEVLQDRSTPTSAGAFEVNVFTVSNNVVPPTITSNGPGTNLIGVGKTTTFMVAATSTALFGYQWQLDGTNIFDSANYSGTASNVLTIRNITIADEGQYTVLLSPSLLESNATTNATAMLLILTNPPVILKQPVSQLGRAVGGIVTFSANVGPYPQGYHYDWLFSSNSLTAVTLTNLEGGNIFITNNVLTLNPALTENEGTYWVVVSNGFNSVDYGVKTSAKVRLTLVQDNMRPTITISAPLANARTNTSLVIGGTATDNAQVTNVIYWITNINAGLTPTINVMSNYAILTTNITTNFGGPVTKLWSITNVPWPGTNILAVQAVNYSGKVSPILARHFVYQVPSPFSLTIVSNGGSGTVTNHFALKNGVAPTNTASLYIGQPYTLVATPASFSLLANWTNANASATNIANGNTLRFIMESNTAIQAVFVTNIFPQPGLHGTFNGLFYAQELATNELVTNTVGTNEIVSTNAIYTNAIAFESAGMLRNLAVGQRGAFSGNLLVAGGNYGLSGAFDGYGHLSNYVVARPKALGPLVLDMDLDTNGDGIITGTVSNAAWPTNAYLWADLAVATHGTSNYTLLMAPPSNAASTTTIPTGYGYALIAEHGGAVTLSGGLADGTTFNQTVPASQSNDVPVYVSLYDKTGFLFGWINLTNLDNTNAATDLIWIKEVPAHPSLLFPDGFTNMLSTADSLWTNPGVITLPPSSTLAISNASLNLDYTVAIEPPDKLVNALSAPINTLTGTINLNTGLLQITFGNGDGRATNRGYGAMLQNTTNVGGYFVTKTNTGSIWLLLPEQ
ncbi:MAG: immunoglobulin domain-containing protein [Verrucomicrobiota bacterium]